MKNIDDFDLYLKNIGANIKKYREKLDITQEKMSELTGVEYKYYQKIENGKSNITLKTLYKISVVLGISPDKLFK